MGKILLKFSLVVLFLVVVLIYFVDLSNANELGTRENPLRMMFVPSGDSQVILEGGEEIAPFLEEMAKNLDAHPVFLTSEDKALYHMSGVMLGGLLTEYAAITTQLWEDIGRSRSDGIRALLPMMRQVANNLERFGLPEAVAGPHARGDVGTVRKHLEALRKRKPELMAFYCELALAGMGPVEEKQVLDETTRNEIINVLKEGLVLARNVQFAEEGEEE